MSPLALTINYSVLIVAASLFGGWVATRFRLSHLGMQVVLSFVGGLMLGIALLHLLPHSIVATKSINLPLWSALIGLLGMFFLIRTFHFHQHGPAAEDIDAAQHEHCDHEHHTHHHLSWSGVVFGLAVHTLMDGIALASAVSSESTHGHRLAGFGVFLAIVLHKPLDALSITTLMQASGWSRNAQQLVNAGFAMMCPLGAAIVLLAANTFGNTADGETPMLIGIALGVSAGIFLCISLGDLLPEVQFHKHDRFKLSVALLMGVAIAFLIGLLEPGSAHSFDAVFPS